MPVQTFQSLPCVWRMDLHETAILKFDTYRIDIKCSQTGWKSGHLPRESCDFGELNKDGSREKVDQCGSKHK